RRAERLFDEGLISKQSFQEARLALDRAETERGRPSTLELKRQQSRVRIDDIGAERIPLQLALSGAYHDLEQCRLDITRRAIIAPLDGRITTMPSLRVGGFLNAGSTLASISPSNSSLVVEAFLPTVDRAFVAAGQPARMQLESASSMVFRPVDGLVSSIA